ncbi:hypothetical protein [Amycolatopsis sp. GM8]|uniref:hypothetical protein n=1 Tax=Amycolatopsis sp. GM8 TaxID=2896530 RepID=UPI001F283D15|nr:hypothetical protein [Amycolatopsis sp. GM8]
MEGFAGVVELVVVGRSGRPTGTPTSRPGLVVGDGTRPAGVGPAGAAGIGGAGPVVVAGGAVTCGGGRTSAACVPESPPISAITTPRDQAHDAAASSAAAAVTTFASTILIGPFEALPAETGRFFKAFSQLFAGVVVREFSGRGAPSWHGRMKSDQSAPNRPIAVSNISLHLGETYDSRAFSQVARAGSIIVVTAARKTSPVARPMLVDANRLLTRSSERRARSDR